LPPSIANGVTAGSAKHTSGIRTGIPAQRKGSPEQELLQHEVRVQFVFVRPGHRSGHFKHAGVLTWQRHRRERAVDRAINKVSGEVVAVGRKAKEMLGRTPGNVVVIKPMKDGVIADFKVTEKMLTYFIQKAHNRRVLVHPRIVIGVPSEITPVEKRAVQDSAYRARASEVYLVEQAMA